MQLHGLRAIFRIVFAAEHTMKRMPEKTVDVAALVRQARKNLGDDTRVKAAVLESWRVLAGMQKWTAAMVDEVEREMQC